VGVPVRIRLLASDVIHSFWVPRLQGKLDLTPGDTNEIQLFAREPGSYRGQCAEYCGLQHAHMALTVVAEPMAAFRAWVADQQQPARPGADPLAAEGAAAFAGAACALCHTVRGTDAHGQVAPDLTHVGSRVSIAAGTLPNHVGTMEAWITNAQSVKPGALMPSMTTFDGRTLRAVATYLTSLK
jgi:cytochrome c oxidase subunit 2